MIIRSRAPETEKEVKSIIDEFATELARIDSLNRQYLGDQEILHKATTGTDKPDNQLVDNFPGYITTVHTGYFAGRPVKYESQNDKLLEAVNKILEFNDEQEHNFEMSKAASKCGIAYEMYYFDEDTNFRIVLTDSEQTIIVHDDTVAHKIIAAIRLWTDAEKYINADVYDTKYITHYKSSKSKKTYTITDKKDEHKFDDVPFTEFPNNRERQGDYEKVMTLIDEYDNSQSETANDFDYFTDAYLAIYGASSTDVEDVTKMKNDRVLLMPEGSDAKWLTKTIQDTASENHKNRLEADIHKFSFTPDMSDESFAGNTSGEAMKYKLWGLEQMAVQKERCFKKGLQRRFKIICSVLTVKGSTSDYREIDMKFTRNMPKVISDMAKVVLDLTGIVPKKMLYALLPFIDDPEEAIKEMEEEQSLDLTRYENDGESTADNTEAAGTTEPVDAGTGRPGETTDTEPVR
ncbi:MAG: phage portal protein [Candidatus Paceibacterota bacterium]|jgi:SPP1 family phage portal protein